MKPLKSIALAGLLGLALAMTAPTTASADPSHRSGKWDKKHEKWHDKRDRKHDRVHGRWNHDHRGANCSHPSHRQVGRYDRRYEGPRYDPRYDGRYGRPYDGRVSRNDACSPIADRIRRDQTEIRRWKYSGRHEKAVKWYEKDLQDAYGDLRVCRGQARHDGRYGPYYGDSSHDRYYDDSYGSYGGGSGFDLGGLLNGLLGGR